MVTASDIAKACRLSQPTVSHILAGRASSYSPRTREKVRQMADRLGYRPNAAARQMRTRRFGAIAMLSRRNIALTHFDTVKGVMRGLAKHDLHLIQTEIDFAHAGKPEDAPRLMRELCVDGIILHDAADIDPDLMDRLSAMRVPAVFVNTAGDHDCVNPDDYDASRRLARAVLDAGHTRVAYVGLVEDKPGVGHYSPRSRADGCLGVLAEAGVEPVRIASERIPTIDDAERVLAEHAGPTAWIVDNTQIATRLFIAARGLRRSVPGDVSIATFRNTRKRMGDHAFRLTAVENPLIDLGVAAAEMIVRKIADPSRRLPVAQVPWSEPIGDTLGPPPVK